MYFIPNHEYHGVEIEALPPKVFNWLEEKMGMSGDRWFIRTKLGSTMIYFRDERDHLIFLITWGNS